MERIEGTYYLDGLIEGKLPGQEVQDRLREWVSFAKEHGLHFNLEIDGSHFSLLGQTQPVKRGTLDLDLSQQVKQAIEQLLRVFAPPEQAGLFSTVRSVEYRTGREVQTLYGLGADGKVLTQERTVEAPTTLPPEPLSRKEILRMALSALAVVALLFGISTFFIDYRKLFSELREKVSPLDIGQIVLEADSFKPYMSFEKRGFAKDGKSLILLCKRLAAYPVKPEDLDKQCAKAGGSVAERLALEAIAAGYLRAELFDKDGKFLGFASLRIAELAQKESLDVPVPLPPDTRPAKVVVRF